jgi:uncharacterized BrkB/YihY/UPF0761 family membrane protein
MPSREHEEEGEANTSARREAGRGRAGPTPCDIPERGLRDVFWRVVSQISKDRVTLVAAGVTFYLLLALFPALTSLVSIYGLVSDTAAIAEQITLLAAVLPSLYRYGPDRDPPKLSWLTWGAALSTLSWLPVSLLFSYYIDNFADYNATYGAMGALIGFMLWIWISTIIIIIGAELNAELEHQTARDSTTGPPKKMGRRDAYVADTIGGITRVVRRRRKSVNVIRTF